MFDREAQRRRAAQQNEALLKQGRAIPVNHVPIRPADPEDMQGVKFRVGQRVARAVKVKNSVGIRICEVTHIAGPQVYLDGSMRPIGHPDRLLVLK